MFTFLTFFSVFNLIYQVFSTLTIYGLHLRGTSFPSFIRDGLRILFILILFLSNLNSIKSYFKVRKKPRKFFSITLIFSVIVSYFFFDKNISDILIGIKYGFWWILILLTSTFIGHILSKKFGNIAKHNNKLVYGLFIVVVIGFIWQILKLIFPDFFVMLGYNLHLDDYYFGANPPIYYLTGYEGTLRRQGLFSGPNNYGYFLVAFLPFILSQVKKKFLNISLLTLRILAIIMTISRAAILGSLVVLVLYFWKFFKSNKKLTYSILGLAILSFVILSVIKRESTLGHITAKLSAIPLIFSHPFGYGLASSGPAIHHGGTFLPENYFFQMLLDTGRIGFILLAITIVSIFRIIIQQNNRSLLITKNPFITGRIALLMMGLVLHVFEDSMVNYLFFIILGITFSLSPQSSPLPVHQSSS